MMDHWQRIINKTTSYYKKVKNMRKIFMIYYFYRLTLVTALKYDNEKVVIMIMILITQKFDLPKAVILTI